MSVNLGAPSFDLTSLLLKAGARIVDESLTEIEEQEKKEAEALFNGDRGCVGVVDDDGEMEEVVETDAGADQLDSDTSEQGEEGEVMNAPVKAPSSVSTGLNLDDEEKHDQLNNSSRFLHEFWCKNVAINNPPRYDLTQDSNNAYGATLYLFFPGSPSDTKHFTLSCSYTSKKEAKDSVARFAMKCDVFNAGRKAKEAADLSGDSKEGVDGIRGATLENIETRTNPFAIVFHGLKKIGVVPVITYQTNKKSAVLYGATLSVTIGLRESKVYKTDSIYLDTKGAKVAISRLVLKMGIIEFATEAMRQQTEIDTGGFIQADDDDVSPIRVLSHEVKRISGSKKSRIQFVPSSTLIDGEGDASEKREHFGGTLSISMGHSFQEQFSVSNLYLSSDQARRAASCVALKSGLIEKARDWRDKKVIDMSIPIVCGSVDPREFTTMESPYTYLVLCLQKITGVPDPVVLEMEVISNEGTKTQFICTLHCSISSTESREFKNEREYATRYEAKDAAARLALVGNIIELADPTGDKRKAGREVVTYSACSTRGSYRGAMRGGGFTRGRGSVGRGGFTGTYRGGKPAFRGSLRTPFATGSNCSSPMVSTSTHRTFSRTPSNTHGYPARPYQPLAGTNHSSTPPRHHPYSTSAASTLQFACQDIMGFGNLPLFEHSQDYQTGLYGAIVKIEISPSNIESFWVDRVFNHSSHAEEAVAQVALEAGIIQTIRTEYYNQQFAPPNSFQPHPPTGSRSTTPYTTSRSFVDAPHLGPTATSTNARPIFNPRYNPRPDPVPSYRSGNHTTSAPQFFKRGSTIYRKKIQTNVSRRGEYMPPRLPVEDGEIMISEEEALVFDEMMEDDSEGLSITSVDRNEVDGMMSSTHTCSPMTWSNKVVQPQGSSSSAMCGNVNDDTTNTSSGNAGMGLISRLARGWFGVA